MSGMVKQFGWMALLVSVLLFQGCAQTGGADGKRADLDKASKLYTDLGLGYMQQGELERAMSKLERALELKPNNADAHHYLAEVYRQLGDDEFAEKHYLRAIKLSPKDARTLNNYGAFLCGQSRFGDAETYFLRAAAVPRYRTPELSYENIAMCAMRVKNSDKAVEYFRKALAIMPTLPKSLYNMALISYNRGDFLRARAFLQRLQSSHGMSNQAVELGIRIETALGDSAAVARYRKMLEERSGADGVDNGSTGAQ